MQPALPAPIATADSLELGWILHEVHALGGTDTADTLTTWLTAGRARISHRDGDAILYAPDNRFTLLDPVQRTYRSTPLDTWERRLVEALATAADSRRGRGTAAPESLRFELEGSGGRVAGHACRRYHLFTEHEIFPGEIEAIEQEIWVTEELAMSPAIHATYLQVLANLDRIELDAVVVRPPGVALRNQVRRRSATGRPHDNEEIEESEVVAIERRAIPRAAFTIPAGYARADSAPPPPPR